MSHLIKSMHGLIQSARGYGSNGAELVVTIDFDSKLFNKLRTKECPLAIAMPQIKNVVLDATGIRSMPSYAAVSMRQRFPRARNGIIRLQVYFDVNRHDLIRMGIQPTKSLYDLISSFEMHKVELNSVLERTRQDGHLLAKTAIVAHLGH